MYQLRHLALAYLGGGETERARSVAAEARAVAGRQSSPWGKAAAEQVWAHVLLRTDGLEAEGEIRESLQRAYDLARDIGARTFLPEIHLDRAGLARLRGDQATRERELREALCLFTETGASGRAARVAEELGL